MNFQMLVQEIETSFPRARVELTSFESGAVDVGIWLDSRFLVVQYSPQHGYGISEVYDNADGLTGHDVVVRSVDEAARAVLALLR